MLLVLLAACRPPATRVDVHAAGVELLRKGDLAAAERLLDQTLSPPGTGEHVDLERGRLWLLKTDVLLQSGQIGRAAQTLDTLPAVPPQPLEARWRKTRGHLAMVRGQFDEASAWLAQAARLAQDSRDERLLLEIEVLQGSVLSRQNRHDEAEAATRAAAAHAEHLGDDYWRAAALNNLGFTRIRRFRYDEALPFFQEALAAAQRMEADRIAAASLINLGACHYRLGDFDAALSALREAIARNERAGSFAQLQASLGEAGNIHALQNDYDTAVSYYRRALDLAKQHAAPDAARWAGNLALALSRQRDWDGAEALNRESEAMRSDAERERARPYILLADAEVARGRGDLARARHLLADAAAVAEAAGNSSLLWQTLATGAAVAAQAGDHQAARHRFEQALAVIETARENLSQRDYRLTFLSRLITFYQDYVRFLVSNDDIARALEIAESSRGRVLAAGLERTVPQASAANAAAYRALARRSGRVVLSYWLAPEQSLLWMVDGDAIRLFELPGAEQLQPMVEAYRRFVEDGMRDPLADASPHARDLSAALLGQVLPFIEPGREVVIVPDGALHGLNFEMLTVGDGQSHYWLEDVSVSVAPSLNLLVQTTARASAGTGVKERRLLVVGDPEPAGDLYPRLPHAAEEIAALVSRFPAARAQVLQAASAHSAAYAAAGPETFDLIHFAAHATANPHSPLDSGIVLSPTADGYMLFARQLLQMPLRAELVTVSACRSAGAKAFSGEGLVGFAWTFLHAGARRVVAGLWEVADDSTATLMDGMYEGIARGELPETALRAAKLRMLRASGPLRKPFYWAPFQVYVRRI